MTTSAVGALSTTPHSAGLAGEAPVMRRARKL
jgi:hypothetical protein